EATGFWLTATSSNFTLHTSHFQPPTVPCPLIHDPLLHCRAVDFLDDAGGHAGHDSVRRHVTGDDGSGGDHGAPADAHAVGDDDVGAEPDVILDDDPFRGDALLDKGAGGVVKDVVDGDNLGERAGIDTIADGHAALPADDAVFPDQAIAPDRNVALRHVAEVVDVQHGAMHDDGVGADADATGRGV